MILRIPAPLHPKNPPESVASFPIIKRHPFFSLRKKPGTTLHIGEKEEGLYIAINIVGKCITSLLPPVSVSHLDRHMNTWANLFSQ